MFSAVLLVALSSGPELPACHRGGHCGGRHGCHGGGSYGGCGGCGGGYCGGGSCGGGYGGGGGCGGGCGGGYCSAYSGGVYSGGGMTMAKADDEAPVTIVVTLPEDAKLTIDDNATASTSGKRTFVSPAVAVGRDYHYTLKAEVVRDGKPQTIEKTVTVRAGEETRVNFDVPTGVAAR
jgi:uncharacterized protein (TIGR03000 family)